MNVFLRTVACVTGLLMSAIACDTEDDCKYVPYEELEAAGACRFDCSLAGTWKNETGSSTIELSHESPNSENQSWCTTGLRLDREQEGDQIYQGSWSTSETFYRVDETTVVARIPRVTGTEPGGSIFLQSEPSAQSTANSNKKQGRWVSIYSEDETFSAWFESNAYKSQISISGERFDYLLEAGWNLASVGSWWTTVLSGKITWLANGTFSVMPDEFVENPGAGHESANALVRQYGCWYAGGPNGSLILNFTDDGVRPNCRNNVFHQ